MKRTGLILGSLFLVAAIAYPAFARGPGWGWGHHMRGYYGSGPGCWQEGTGYAADVTPEDMAKLEELDRRFHDETADLRSKIWSKRGELNALMNSSDPDVEKAKSVQRELNDLRNQMAEKRLEHQIEVRKIAPETGYPEGYGRGYSGKRGHGPDPGYGWKGKGYGRGYGPGACWK
jgi:zinc resistance-associated protein